jgi:trigger factor
VRVLEIKEKLLAELDDEFAKGVGDEYESLEALRAGILENLIAQTESATKITFQEKSLVEVVKGASVQVSGLTTNREIDHLLEDHISQEGQRVDMDTYLRNAGKSREELRDEVRPNAQDRMTRYLVIRKLAQDENIEVSPDEIDAEVENLAASMGQSGESIREAFSTESARSSISSAILNRKVLERLAEIVQGGVGSDEEEPSPQGAQDSVEDAQMSEVEVETETNSEAATPQIAGSGRPDEAQGDEGGTPSDDQSL